MEGSASILVTEPAGVVARFLGQRLSDQPHRIRWVGSVREARIELREQPPDVLVLDASIGSETLEFLQAARFPPDGPRGGIVVLAARTDTVTRERALQLGAAVVVTTPVAADELATAVQSLIDAI